MAKKNNIPMVSAINDMMDSFKPEKLSLNPIKRHRQKKLNAIKRKNLQALAVASATTGIAGGVIGTVSGYHVGKQRKTKMVLETMEEYGISKDKMKSILAKKAPKDILLAEDDDDEESDDSAPQIPRHDKDPVSGSILIREDVGPNDYVVSPSGDVMDGFCLNGTEPEHVVMTLLLGRGVQAMDYVNVIHDFNDLDLGKDQGEWIRAFCEEHNVRVNEVDDSKYHHKVVRDEAVDEDGNLLVGQDDDDSDEDDLVGMNSVTDQSAIDDRKFPTPKHVAEEEEELEDDDDEESEESVFVGLNGDAVHLTKAPESVDPGKIDAFFFGKASSLFMMKNPDVDEADIKLASPVDDKGHTVLDLAYSLYMWYMRRLAAHEGITDPTILREKFDELMADYRKRQEAREKVSDSTEKVEPEKADESEEDEEDGELFGVPDFGNSIPDDMTDETEESKPDSSDDNKEEVKND